MDTKTQKVRVYPEDTTKISAVTIREMFKYARFKANELDAIQTEDAYFHDKAGAVWGPPFTEEDKIEAMVAWSEGARTPAFQLAHYSRLKVFLESQGYEVSIPRNLRAKAEDPNVRGFFNERVFMWFNADGSLYSVHARGKGGKFRVFDSKKTADEVIDDFITFVTAARKAEKEKQDADLARANEFLLAKGAKPWPSYEDMKNANHGARK